MCYDCLVFNVNRGFDENYLSGNAKMRYNLERETERKSENVRISTDGTIKWKRYDNEDDSVEF